MIYKLNLMNSKPSLMNLTSNYRSHISSFESNFKNIIMKRLLQLSIFLWSILSLGQAPVVSNPTLVTAADNSLAISSLITPNGSTQWSIIYSEDAFFTPNVTYEINNIATLTGSSPVTVSYTIQCLNSGDNYYVKVKAVNISGTTTSGYTTMSTTGSVFNNYPKVDTFSVSNLTTTSARINLGIDNNANIAVTGALYYGLSETTMTNILAVPTTSTDNATTFVDLSSLSPNTTYYVRINLNNGTNCTNSVIRQFTTPMVTTLLYHFPFNGNRNSIVNSGTFNSGIGFGTFVSDGLGNSTGALEVAVNSGNYSTQTQSANLPLLPQGNTSRSVVMRIRFNNASMTHYVMSWGSPSNSLSYGFEKTQAQGCSSVWGNNVCFADATIQDTWATITITYDGTTNTAQYYKNGSLVSQQNHSVAVNTTGADIRLGTSLAANFGNSNFWIDDLKIYSGVLTSTQIATLSSSDFNTNNLNIAMYPNPSNELVNIDLESQIKSIEIYSLQGQKVITATSKQVNVSHLSNGVYMVRVEDENGAIATKKLVKN